MPVLALVSDLMMQSQVSGAARAAGVELKIATGDAALVALAEKHSPGLVIVDLSHPGLDPAGLMEQLRPHLAENTKTLAFGPHVHKAKLEAAAAAGFGAVISRGQFHASLDTILRESG